MALPRGSLALSARLHVAHDGHVSLALSPSLLLGGGRWTHARLATDAQRGRHMLSSAFLPAGTIVCEAAALALCPLEEWRKRVCASCLAVAPSRLSNGCHSCESCFYCDGACAAAHAPSHARACAALRRLGALRKYGKDLQAMLRLLLDVLLAAPHEGKEMFFALEHHPPRRDRKAEAEWRRACALFRHALEACEGVEARGFSDEEIHALVSRLDSNCFGCYIEDSRREGAPPFAHGCYPAASLFNHSCAPNCTASTGLERIHIITHADVQCGEELTIAYIDVQRPRAARQAELRLMYHFVCACHRCAAEAIPAAREKCSYASAPRKQRTRREQKELRSQRRAAAQEGRGDGVASGVDWRGEEGGDGTVRAEEEGGEGGSAALWRRA
ncbi:hypothetical protein AB1Y20_014696 [Prymnesium parvum]|uniref:SET domain-containing protein n=1 Tax=Prymnesium parvum TaxID=97485 RepID=A0AB34IES8_PRYPA